MLETRIRGLDLTLQRGKFRPKYLDTLVAYSIQRKDQAVPKEARTHLEKIQTQISQQETKDWQSFTFARRATSLCFTWRAD
jgi:hypothetical protein